MLDVLPIGIKEENWYKDEPAVFTIPPETRRKHVAMFGATGAGKSTLLRNMISWDLDAGTGVTVVDPHGGLYEQLLDGHIPRRRKNDVILFDPKDREHVLGLNVLDCPRKEERGLVVSHVVGIFNKLWASAWGARLEDTLRNALWVLIEQSEPLSLLALPRLLTNEAYRSELMRDVHNPAVLDFFINTFDKWTKGFREEAISPVLNKARAFMTDDMMRAIIGQSRSSFNFRWAIDTRKILLCNLAKGSIGDDNSRLLGSLIVLKEKLAAISREDTPAESARVPHALYVEEAQSFIGDFQSILAETRKYSLPLTIATQGIESLSPEDASAVFTNCATLISFRVSGADAHRLATEFGTDIAANLLNLEDYLFYVRTLTRKREGAGASPSGPHRVKSHAPFGRHPRHASRESVIRTSQARYAKPRATVEEELRRKFFSHADRGVAA